MIDIVLFENSMDNLPSNDFFELVGKMVCDFLSWKQSSSLIQGELNHFLLFCKSESTFPSPSSIFSLLLNSQKDLLLLPLFNEYRHRLVRFVECLCIWVGICVAFNHSIENLFWWIADLVVGDNGRFFLWSQISGWLWLLYTGDFLWHCVKITKP